MPINFNNDFRRATQLFKDKGELLASLSLFGNLKKQCEDVEYVEGIARCYLEIGEIHQRINNPSKSFDYLQNSLKMYMLVGSLDNIGILQLNLSRWHIESGDLLQARRLVSDARKNFQSNQSALGIARAKMVDGQICIKEKKLEKAGSLLCDAANTFKRESMRDEGAISLILLGQLEEAKYHFSEAQEYYKEALIIYESLQQSYLAYDVKYLLARCYLKSDKYNESISLLNDIISYCEDKRITKRSCEAKIDQAQAFNKIANSKKAKKLLYGAIDDALEINNFSLLTDATVSMATIKMTEGTIADALKSLVSLRKDYFEKLDNRRQARLNESFGDCYMLMGNHKKALKYYDDAIEYHETEGDAVNAARAYSNKAIICRDYSDYTKALALFKQSASLFRECNNRFKYADTCLYIVDMLLLFNRYHEIKIVLEIAKTIFEDLNYGNGLARIFKIQADIAISYKHHDKAKELLTNAVKYVHNDPDLLSEIYSKFAVFYHSLGDFHAAAEAAKTGIDILSKTNKIKTLLMTKMTLGAIYCDMGETSQARQILLEIEEADKNLLNIIWNLNLFLGKSHINYDNEKAINYFTKAIKIIEETRKKERTELRQYYLDHAMSPFRELISLYVSLSDYSNAVRIMEKCKSSYIIDYLNNELFLRCPDKEIQQELEKTKNQIQTDIIKYSIDRLNNKGNAELSNDSEKLVEQVNADIRKISELKAKYHISTSGKDDSIVQENSLNLSNISAEHVLPYLNSNELILNFFVAPHKVYLAIIAPHVFEIEQLSYETVDLDNLVKEIISSFNLKNENGAKGFSIPNKMIELSSEIINIIEKYSKNTDTIIFIPHLFTNLIPFAALFQHSGANGINTIRYLVEDYKLANSSSLTALLHSKKLQNNVRSESIIIDGTLTKNDSDYMKLEAKEVANLLSLPVFNGNIPNDLFDTINHISLDTIHLSCHGVFVEDSDEATGVILAPNKMISVHDIINSKTHSNLIVLSACETALVDFSPGDDALSVLRALSKNNKSVIASLWGIEDKSTRDIIKSFYRYRVYSQQTISKAFQQSQIDYIKKARNDSHENMEGTYTLNYRGSYNYKLHPYFWAGLQLYGDWE